MKIASEAGLAAGEGVHYSPAMSRELERAAEILRSGGIVAFPTETVYGLGADATNAAAVRRVFEVKGRPPTNPCIVHVADEQVARRFVLHWPSAATRLVERFWPGPLTLVLAKTGAIAPEVTAGLPTVGLRAPDHPLTLELLRRFDGPLVGPSANRSTHLSPTMAQHVREELGDTVDMILDGGACRVGIESTVLDLSGEEPTILRPGVVLPEQIEQVIGPVRIRPAVVDPGQPASSPGQHPVHYAPQTPTYRYESGQTDLLVSWCAAHPDKRAIVLRIGAAPVFANLQQIQMPFTAGEYARKMYAALREADRQSAAAIWIEMPPDQPQWLAVRDRLIRASRRPAG